MDSSCLLFTLSFYLRIGSDLIDLIYHESQKKKMKAICLDVYKGHLYAIQLYKKCGFHYIHTVDLGLSE